MAERACGNCTFYHDGEGACLRYAPRREWRVKWMAALDSGQEGATEWVIPAVDAEMNWCGEWERRMSDRKLGGWNPESGLFDG